MNGLRIGACTPAQVGERVAELTRDLADQGCLTRRQAYRLRLAADEITTNIATHGYRDGPGLIDVTTGIEPDRVWLRIEDESPPFDPYSHDPDPHLALDPHERELGRLGLYLATVVTDELRYDRVAGRNRNTLIMHRTLDQDGGSDGGQERPARR